MNLVRIFAMVRRFALSLGFFVLLFSFSAVGQTVPNPSSPPNGSADQPTSVTLRWSPVLLATSYEVQVATNSDFQTLTRDLSGIGATSAEITGMEHGRTYYWRVRAVVTLAPGAWSETWNFTTSGLPATHPVFLNKGWNMISSYIRPNISHLDTMVSGIMNNLVIIKNGRGEVYFPAVANTLLNWDFRDGYQVFMRAPDALTIDGNVTVPQVTPLDLPQGWNLISYLRADSISVESALSGIASNIVIVKNSNGRVYWPEFGINQIGFMKPGEGYQLYLSAASTLTYPNNPEP